MRLHRINSTVWTVGTIEELTSEGGSGLWKMGYVFLDGIAHKVFSSKHFITQGRPCALECGMYNLSRI